MPLLSAALGRVRPSATIAMTTRAQEMAAAGRDVIGLAAGEPDLATPAHIAEAGVAAIRAGRTRYTAVDGMPELKAAICRKFERDNGLAVAPPEVSVGTGGKQVIFNALAATLDPGAEVIVPAPYWTSYPDMVRLAGGEPVVVAAGAEQGFRVTPEAVEAAIGPRTRWLILNSPSNPTGAAYDAQALAGLAEMLLRHPQLWVMADDIYEHLLFDGRAFATLASVAPALAGRVLTVNGVSKAYAMTGWRIGYAAGPAPLIRAMAKVQSQTTSNPCTVSQWAALAALEGPQDLLAANRRLFQGRRDLVVGLLREAEGIDCPLPEGAFYVYPSIAALIGRTSRAGRRIASDEDFALALIEEAGVAVVPGAAFGLSPAFRVSYALDEARLREACARIAEFCAGLS
jgi:aspartate aminotransferase